MSGNAFGSVLVVGGGIGGMQAALDLSDAGFRVYLVERSANVGGSMSQLDKTFPTNDCAMCIMSPRVVAVGRDRNIKVLAHTELVGLAGTPGNFSASVLCHPRYVDPSKCTGCGACTQVCPVEVGSEYNQGMSARKAIYINYPQAVPSTHGIDRRQPPCVDACPLHLEIREWVGLIAEGRDSDALALIRTKLPLPGVIGRICDHPCETACLRGQRLDDALSICALKRFAADQEVVSGQEVPLPPVADGSGRRVAVVGSGPAGLSAAFELRLAGHEVVVFEAQARPGGMLRYGIPSYRLPRDVLDREIARILSLGIELRTGKRIGRDFSLESLRAEFDAVFLATGAHLSRSLPIAGAGLPGVLPGLDFLQRMNSGERIALGQRVLVIGGGNVAIDVALSAKRLGAEQVRMICLEGRQEMPAHEWEIRQAFADGIQISYSWGAVRVLDVQGKVVGLESQRCIAVFDTEGFFNPSFDRAAKRTFVADTVIVAIGQACDLGYLHGQEDIEKDKRGTLRVDPLTLQTGAAGVFAGGDVVSGPASAVKAIAAGRWAAESIDRFLCGRSLREGRESDAPRLVDDLKTLYQARRRALTKQRSPAKPGLEFDEIDQGYDEPAARREAERCLSCRQCLGCRLCEESCEAKAIDFSQKPERLELEVGAVILAPGFDECDPSERKELGYGRYKNVVTSIEFERMLSATGPFSSMVLRPSDGVIPKRVAWIQCVGSRTKDHDFCSSVCCMAATKEAVIAKEHHPRFEPTIFFMDIRAFGKGFDAYFERAKEHGVRYVRSMVSKVVEDPSSKNLQIVFAGDSGRPRSEEFEMVVLSVGMRPKAGMRELASALGVAVDAHGFCQTDPFRPVATSRAGVFVCGAFESPKDIPETVAQASGAAAFAASGIAEARHSCIEIPQLPPERNVEGKDPRIGVFVCHCGVNIGSVVNVPDVAEFAAKLPGVVHTDHNLFTCSQDTQARIKKAIAEHDLNRVVVASCSPRTHEPLFQLTVREAGLNRYLFDMANIRDQCSWVHMHDKPGATEKAKQLVRMAVANAALLAPIREVEVPVHHAALVIGGGLAGLSAAQLLSRQGFPVTLVEKTQALGGNLRRLRQALGGLDVQERLRQLIDQVEADPKIEVLTGAELIEFGGAKGGFRTRIRVASTGDVRDLEHGVAIVATGARERKPHGEYLYGEDQRVMTQQEFEERLADPSFLKGVRRVVMIQCVGSRVPERPYCSRICCSVAIKNALRVKEVAPEVDLHVLARDVRTYGLMEQYYTEARKKGIVFTRYEPVAKPEVEACRDGLLIRVLDQVLHEQVEMEADLLVLSSAIIPEDDQQLGKLMRLPRTLDGFFLESHMKLRPVDFASDGVYLAGMAHGPKLIQETVAQAAAAVARAVTVLSKEKLVASGVVSEVDPDRCAACLTCVRICPYDVPTIGDDGVAVIDPIQCHGCGSCAAECPGKAIQLRHYRDQQLVAKATALVKEEVCDERL